MDHVPQPVLPIHLKALQVFVQAVPLAQHLNCPSLSMQEEIDSAGRVVAILARNETAAAGHQVEGAVQFLAVLGFGGLRGARRQVLCLVEVQAELARIEAFQSGEDEILKRGEGDVAYGREEQMGDVSREKWVRRV